MSKSVLSAKHFHDEEAAYSYLEKRVWPNGPVCPHCGGFERISKMQGKATRIPASAFINAISAASNSA
jgi:hypothetical protein